MSLNIQTVSDSARQIAAKLGISKFDLSGSTIDETSVQVDKGEPKQVKASNRSGITVRVWNNENTVGITSTTDVDDIGLELALKTAHEASFFGIKEHAPDFSPEATAPIAELEIESGEAVAVPQLIESLVAAERKLLDTHEAIESVPYNGLAQRSIEQFYLNSAGALRSEARTYTSLYLYTKTEQEGKKPRSAGAFEMSHSFAKLDVQKCIDEAAEKTISHLNYEKVASGKYTIVFSPDAFLSLLGAFSNLFNAQSILDNQSLSTPESLGTTIASSLLSVADDALHPSNIGIEAFDGEGTPTRRVNLIDKGVLSSFIHSAGTAKRMNTRPTGHANMGSKITVSPHFYHVSGGEKADDNYNLDTAENVILIDDLQALHAGVQSLQGSFSLPFDGWVINKGVKTSVEAATVAGDFRELLNSIVFIEPKEDLTTGGVCPRIWVEGLSVTGE
ncbi:TldD/PmbA family protein [Chamaesiphon sp.]|uniref:TldD/PmbA family protein n=1 Tax=Chamaesiphon sp. TaxID=2814140 RepID=UPI003592F9C9